MNRGVSLVADVEAKLTEATSTARTRQRPRNELETKAVGDDVFSGVHTALGEDGSSAGVRVREVRGVIGARLQKGSNAWARWPGDARRGRIHGRACVQEVRGKEGANMRGQRGSGRGRMGKWGGADRRDPLQREKEGATGARGARRRRQAGPTGYRESGDGSERELGLAG